MCFVWILFIEQFYLENSSMLKNTYSPLPTMLSSSAANMISRMVLGLAHIITTAETQAEIQIERNEEDWKLLLIFLRVLGYELDSN